MKVVLILLFSMFAQANTKIIQTATKAQEEVLKQIDKAYVGSSGLIIELAKKDEMALLETTTSAKGKLWLRKGKLKLNLIPTKSTQGKSTIIVNGKQLWFINEPPKGMQGKLQVARRTLAAGELERQGLLSILNNGGLMRHFKVYGVHTNGNLIEYLLDPKKQSLGIKKASVVMDKESLEIKSLKYRDTSDNKTEFTFTKTQKNASIQNAIFNYRPPKGVKVVRY